ncbi:hypothetical protein ACVWYZ_001597 [Thermostichus sp. MS-CIW-37]
MARSMTHFTKLPKLLFSGSVGHPKRSSRRFLQGSSRRPKKACILEGTTHRKQ